MNNEDKFISFHNNIMGCVHYRDTIAYIIDKWDIHHKKDLLSLLVENMIKRE